MARSKPEQRQYKNQEQQKEQQQVDALAQSRKYMLLVWLCTVVVGFLVYARIRAGGVQANIFPMILLGILLLCCVAATSGYIRYMQGKGRR